MIGLLEMEDEEGVDHKIICVPASPKIDPICGAWASMADVPQASQEKIRHFFEHYKDLEPEKWVKLKDWKDIKEAEQILAAGKQRFQQG
jgi:inorganic pyrophosphatase